MYKFKSVPAHEKGRRGSVAWTSAPGVDGPSHQALGAFRADSFLVIREIFRAAAFLCTVPLERAWSKAF